MYLSEQLLAPLLGDSLYPARIADPRIAAIGDALGRQALHAAVLGYVHPMTGEAQRWESPMPADMSRAVEALAALAGEGVS